MLPVRIVTPECGNTFRAAILKGSFKILFYLSSSGFLRKRSRVVSSSDSYDREAANGDGASARRGPSSFLDLQSSRNCRGVGRAKRKNTLREDSTTPKYIEHRELYFLFRTCSDSLNTHAFRVEQSDDERSFSSSFRFVPLVCGQSTFTPVNERTRWAWRPSSTGTTAGSVFFRRTLLSSSRPLAHCTAIWAAAEQRALMLLCSCTACGGLRKDVAWLYFFEPSHLRVP